MSYHGRSHGHGNKGNDEEYKKNTWSKKVNHEKSAEVIVGMETSPNKKKGKSHKYQRTEQFIVFKYAKIMLITNQL